MEPGVAQVIGRVEDDHGDRMRRRGRCLRAQRRRVSDGQPGDHQFSDNSRAWPDVSFIRCDLSFQLDVVDTKAVERLEDRSLLGICCFLPGGRRKRVPLPRKPPAPYESRVSTLDASSVTAADVMMVYAWSGSVCTGTTSRTILLP